MICLALILFQLLVAKFAFDRAVWPRAAVWCVVLGCYLVAHLASLENSGFERIVLLCSVLIAGMKWVMYAEWRREGGQVLPWSRWVCFAFLWFGTDPRPWLRSRSPKSWLGDFRWGLACLIVGICAVTLLAHYACTNLQLLFIAMSIGFHFGALRLLVAFWKLQGFGVRPLFRNPLMMRGFVDFWSKRWNLAYSQMMARAVLRPLCPVCGKQWAQFSVFAVSGLLHELAITVPVRAGYGMPTLFFLVQGAVTGLEKKESRYMAAFCGMSLVVGLPVLFPEGFAESVIIPARDFMKF